MQRNLLTNLPSHYKFEIDFEFFSIDNFAGNTMNIYFDSVIVAQYNFQLSTIGYEHVHYKSLIANNGGLRDGYFSFTDSKSQYGYSIDWIANKCNYPDNEYGYFIKVLSEHNSSTLNLTIQIANTTNAGWWGIKNINYFVWSKAFPTNCYPACTTCNNHNCAYCDQPYYMQDDVCVSVCLDNYFQDNTNTNYIRCFKCYTGCSNCYDDDPDSCFGCSSGYYLYGNNCLLSCPTGYLANSTTNNCDVCVFNCTTCIANMYYSYGSCLTSCLSNEYLNITNNSCLYCDISCLTCNGPYNNNCTSCPLEKYYSSGLCVASCENSQFVYNLNNTCMSCDSSCQSCVDFYNTNCSSCPEGKYFSYGSCVSQCDSSQYMNSSNSSCAACDISCLTCNGPSNNSCTSCPLNNYYSYGNCIAGCASNQYFNITNNSCNNCDLTCMTCNGPYSTNCTSCNPAIQYFSYGSCIESCLSWEYLNVSNNSCNSCDSICLTCVGPYSDNCTSCPQGLYYSKGSCVVNCSSSQYLNISNNECSECNTNCQTCIGPNANNCTSCSSTQYFSYGSCVNSCSTHQYLNISNNSCDSCDHCDSTCQTSIGPNLNDCTSCYASLYFSNITCVPNCNSSQYLNYSNNSCEFCESKCLSCSGPDNNSCLSCSLPDHLYSSHCISICPISSYLDTLTNICNNCYINCLTCQGPSSNECTSCQSNLYYTDGSCINNCSMTQYINYTNNSCNDCNTSCNSCDGPTSNDCLSCPSNTFYSNRNCLDNCLTYQYLNVSNNSCDNCDVSCQTCNGPYSSNCSSCDSYSYLSNGSCNNICSIHQYYDIYKKLCYNCHNSCFNCIGSNYTDCIGCYSGLLLNNGLCVRSICYSYEYWDVIDINCHNCSNSCLTCLGPYSNNCLSCFTGFLLISNQCLPPIQLYLSVIPINNPFSFILIFSNDSQLYSNVFFEKLNQSIIVNISNYNQDLFSYALHNITYAENYSINFTFFDNIIMGNSYLDILINNTFDDTIILMNSSFHILLNTYDLCEDNSHYYDNGTCFPKTIIDYNWKYTDTFNIISLLFTSKTNNSGIIHANNRVLSTSTLNPILVQAIIDNVFYLKNTILKPGDKMTYQFNVIGENVEIVFFFSNSLFVQETMVMRLNESKLYEVKDSQKITIISKELYITIINEYMYPDQANMMENTRQISQTGEIATSALIYLSYVTSPKSTFAIRGMLLINIFQLLKYLTIIYPINAKVIFTNSRNNRYFIKNDIIAMSDIHELLHGLPQLYLSYNVDLYILNNLLDEYILIFMILAISLIFLMFQCENSCFISKILIFLKLIFVWSFFIMMAFSKYITTVFYTLVSLKFSFFYDKYNTMISLTVLAYILCIPFHLMNIISIVNDLEDSHKEIIIYRKNLLYKVNVNKADGHSEKNERKTTLEINKKSNFFQLNEMIQSKIKKSILWENFGEYQTPQLKNAKIDESDNVDTYKQPESRTSELCIATSSNSPSNKKNPIIWKKEAFDIFFTNSSKDLVNESNDINNQKSSKSSSNKIYPSMSENKDPFDLLVTNQNSFNNQNISKLASNNIINKEPLDTVIQSQKTFIDHNSQNNVKLNIFNEKSSFVNTKKNICIMVFANIYNLIYTVKNKEAYLKKYLILRRDFRENLGLHRYYFVLDLLRYFSIPLVVVVMYGYPLIQMVLLEFINLLFLMFLIFQKPFKNKINQFFTILNEICINCSYLAAMVLAILDLNENQNINYRINLGWVIVFCYILLLFSLLINSCFRLYKSLLNLIRYFCKKNNKIQHI